MKRAEVARWGSRGQWFVDYFNYPATEEIRSRRIRARGGTPFDYSMHPTHTEALAHALAEVGLASAPEHREAP